jgi:hypothetical protein
MNHRQDKEPAQPSPVIWRKATASNGTGGNCVEVALLSEGSNDAGHSMPEATRKADHGPLIAMRDSKDPDGPRLYFTRSEFAAFRHGILAGEFDDLA